MQRIMGGKLKIINEHTWKNTPAEDKEFTCFNGIDDKYIVTFKFNTVMKLSKMGYAVEAGRNDDAASHLAVFNGESKDLYALYIDAMEYYQKLNGW